MNPLPEMPPRFRHIGPLYSEATVRGHLVGAAADQGDQWLWWAGSWPPYNGKARSRKEAETAITSIVMRKIDPASISTLHLHTVERPSEVTHA